MAGCICRKLAAIWRRQIAAFAGAAIRMWPSRCFRTLPGILQRSGTAAASPPPMPISMRRHRATERDRRWSVSAGAVPRPHLGFQGYCAAGAGTVVQPARWPSAAAAPLLSRRPAATPARPPSRRWAACPISMSLYASARPGQRRAAPADDHQRPRQCPQYRAGRQLRRRPGHREGSFRRHRIRREVGLTAVNSINFARIAAQCVYYFTATAALGKPATFVVPTGNFGDIFAGEAARRMGLDIGAAGDRHQCQRHHGPRVERWRLCLGRSHATLSPSMDIQVASNFERALFEASRPRRRLDGGRDGRFRQGPHWSCRADVLAALRGRYSAFASDDAETLAAIKPRSTADTGRIIDPHTAVGVAARANMPASAADGDPVHRASGEIPRRGDPRHRRAATEPKRLQGNEPARKAGYPAQ